MKADLQCLEAMLISKLKCPRRQVVSQMSYPFMNCCIASICFEYRLKYPSLAAAFSIIPSVFLDNAIVNCATKACGIQNLSKFSFMVKYRNLIGSANIPAAVTETWHNSPDSFFKRLVHETIARSFRQLVGISFHKLVFTVKSIALHCVLPL